MVSSITTNAQVCKCRGGTAASAVPRHARRARERPAGRQKQKQKQKQKQRQRQRQRQRQPTSGRLYGNRCAIPRQAR
ncbi:hypothetical protein D7U93_03390 [Stenotrophomonas maltophilia]|nr:hypothetical protein [Stenotrophomonas maltophilia]MBA0407116.1 hypothetical protein [Stenotrophomonas maltophilia]MBA0425770.1 hypothetical protein [Stenotrophomonas maltophilia]